MTPSDMEGTRLLGIGGYAESGKDALADILVAEFEWAKTYMSRPLEEALLTLNPMIPVEFLTPIEMSQGAGGGAGHPASPGIQMKSGESRAGGHGRVSVGVTTIVHHMTYKQYHAVAGYTGSKKNAEVRRLLQVLGTEIGRNMFGEDSWVKLAEATITAGLDLGSKVCITGIRYANELEMIHRHKGVTVWMDRGGEPVNDHSSDNTLSPNDFDVVVHNTGTLKDLHTWIRKNF